MSRIAMNMPMLMAVKPTQALTLMERCDVRINVTIGIPASRSHAPARRENTFFDPNASSDQRQVERGEDRRDRGNAKGEGQHCDFCDYEQVIRVPDIAVRAGSHEWCIRQGDDARRPVIAQARDHPDAAQLEQRKYAEQQPVRWCRCRHEYGEASKPARMQQHVERVGSGICLDSTAPTQRGRVAPGADQLDETLQCNQSERPVKRSHRLSRTRKPAVKPGPRAFIRARSQLAPVTRALASIRSSTNITVEA